MAANVLVDAGFLVGLLSRRETHHQWTIAQSKRFPPQWKTCDAVLSEAFHVLGGLGSPALTELLRRGAVVSAFDFAENSDEVLILMEKYADVPMSFADACLVRMTEMLANPVLLTLDADFGIYRRHGRRAIPCVTPD